METLERFAFVFVVNAVWQVALVAGIAMVFDRVLGRAPARFRNLLWRIAILAAALLPFARLFDRAAPRVGTSAAQAVAGSPSVVGSVSGIDPWAWIGSRLPQEGLAAQIGGGLTRVVVILLLLFVAWRAFRLFQAWRRTVVIHRSVLDDAGPDHAAVARCREAMSISKADVRYSGIVGAPAALGILRPTIILPTAMRSSEFEEDFVASVAHEMAHIRRRDYLVNLLTEIVTLPICWHPVTAHLKRMARATCEMACDELATRSLVGPAEYARALVRIAERLTLDRRVGHTLGILDADVLEVRVMKLVDRRPRSSASRAAVTVAVATFVLCVSSVGAAALSFRVQDPSAAPSDADIVGTWIVSATQDGADPAKQNPEAEEMMHPEITLSIDNGVLVGTVVFPKVEKDSTGAPTVTRRDPVPVTDPVYRNGTFRFRVNNGEEFLIGELKIVDEGLKGRWISSESKLSGTLTMKRVKSQ